MVRTGALDDTLVAPGLRFHPTEGAEQRRLRAERFMARTSDMDSRNPKVPSRIRDDLDPVARREPHRHRPGGVGIQQYDDDGHIGSSDRGHEQNPKTGPARPSRERSVFARRHDDERHEEPPMAGGGPCWSGSARGSGDRASTQSWSSPAAIELARERQRSDDPLRTDRRHRDGASWGILQMYSEMPTRVAASAPSSGRARPLRHRVIGI